MGFEPEKAGLRVLRCALKHKLTEEEIRAAWRHPQAMRYRNFDIPCFIASAGVGANGQLIEMLGAEQDDGTIVIYHAMNLTNKMADELGI